MNMIIGLLCTIYTVLLCCTVLDCTICNGIGIGFGVTRHITMPLLAPYAQAQAISIDRTEHDYLLLMCGCADWMGLHVRILWSIAVRGVETEARAADANNRAVREEAGQMHRHDPQAAPREGVLLVLLLLLLPPSSFLLPAPLPFATPDFTSASDFAVGVEADQIRAELSRICCTLRQWKNFLRAHVYQCTAYRE